MEGIEERGSYWGEKQLPIKLPLFEYDFYLCICCQKNENNLEKRHLSICDVYQAAGGKKLLILYAK